MMTELKAYGSWNMSLLSWCAFKDMYKEGKDCNPMFLEFKNNKSYYYQTEEALDGIKKGVFEKAKKNRAFFEQEMNRYALLFKTDKKNLERINQKLKDPSVDLAALFEEYWVIFSTTIFGMAIDIYFDDIIAKQLFDYLEKKLAQLGIPDKLQEYNAVLTAPHKLTTSLKEEIGFLTIAEKAGRLNKKETDALLQKHLEKYAFVPVWFDNSPWTLQDLKNRLEREQQQDFKTKLEQAQKIIPTNIKKSEGIIKELEPPAEIIRAISLLQEFTFLRQEGEVQIGYNNYAGFPLKKQIADRLSVSFEELKFLTSTEITQFLKIPKTGIRSAIGERQQHAFMIMENGECRVYTGMQAKKELDKLKITQESEVADKKEIFALVGAPGYTKGKAKIVKGFRDIEKLQDGDILIVSGLSVEYIDAIKKSAAVVSEIGGITSHAAIMCREFKKPCLIRVKDATKIFKDGDTVEVDANKGIVRKIR